MRRPRERNTWCERGQSARLAGYEQEGLGHTDRTEFSEEQSSTLMMPSAWQCVPPKRRLPCSTAKPRPALVNSSTARPRRSDRSEREACRPARRQSIATRASSSNMGTNRAGKAPGLVMLYANAEKGRSISYGRLRAIVGGRTAHARTWHHAGMCFVWPHLLVV